MITLRLLASLAFRWSTHSYGVLILGLVVVGIDFVGLIGSSATMLIVEVVALSYGIARLVGDVAKDWIRHQRLYEQKRAEPLLVPYEPPYDSWSSISLGSWHAVNDPTLDAALAADRKIQVERVKRRWKPEDRIKMIRSLRRLALDFDQDKIRLASDLLASTNSVVLQRVPYSAFMVTNKLGIVNIKEYGDRELLGAESVILRSGLLPCFDRSRCSNHLGADVIAVVDDGRILVTRQSAKNQLNEDLLVSSGSGSIDWKDLRRGDDLITMVKRAMRREMLEELGIARSGAPSLESMRVLGYARFKHLGGKPQFFGVVRLGSANERIRGMEKRYIADHVTIDFTPKLGVDDLLRAINAFEADQLSEMSFSLYVNLQLFKRWISADPNAAKWLGLVTH